MSSQPAVIRDNLSKQERESIKKLQKCVDIVIKPADKGSGTVIMDCNWYVDECLRELNDNKYYQTQTKDLTVKIQQRIKEYTSRMYNDELIDEKTYKYLTSNSNPRAGRFYILPAKIHKQGNPGRPIISSNGHPTERISEFGDYHLKPLVQTLPSYIKDTTTFFSNSRISARSPKTLSSSRLMFLPYTLTYHIRKAKKLKIYSPVELYANVSANIFGASKKTLVVPGRRTL